MTHEAYDFEGNLLRQARRLAAAYEETVDWSTLAELEDVTDLENAAAEQLEEEAFETSGTFDALGRPVSQTSPDATLLRYGYNEAALLESVTGRVRGANEETTFVSNVDYNARGQRTLVAYGNGTQTAYTYDPQTFRLERLRTQGGGQTYQDLRYWFDAAGNIVEQQDGAQQSTYFGNAVVEPGQRFAYDAQSRLGWASGREHRSLSQPTHESFGSVAHREDGAGMRRYTQRYVYDVVGNILRMQHAADGGDSTRRYVYAEDGNRLVANSGPEDAAGQHSHTYGYDAHGNMTSMPHLSAVQWDFADRMQRADLGGGGTAYFVYDAGGERVRKVRVNEGGGRSFERIYVGGFEVYRARVGGTVRLERETVHVGDDAGRMCLLETRTVRDGAAVAEPQTGQLYQYGNHLGSASLELTEDREVISYEEYHPYGTSSYRAANSGVDVSERRYRYTGKERDEETGLGYHGARYYACWLGRWTASDPIGLGDGVNRYVYVSGNPISLRDPSGTQAMSPPISEEDYTRLSDVSLDSFGIEDEPEPKPKSKSTEKEPDRSGDRPISAESHASKAGRAKMRTAGEARSGREYDASRTVGDAVTNSGGLGEVIVEEALGAVPILGWAVDAKGLYDAIEGFNESPGILRGAGVVLAGAGFILPFTGRFGKGLRHLDDVIEEGGDLARRADGVPSRTPDSGSTSPSGLGDEVDAVPGGNSAVERGGARKIVPTGDVDPAAKALADQLGGNAKHSVRIEGFGNREFDVVTDDFVAQAFGPAGPGKVPTFVSKPKNFLSKSRRTQIRETLRAASETDRAALFEFTGGTPDAAVLDFIRRNAERTDVAALFLY